MPSNDNDPRATPPLPHAGDAHGHAALMLVESLIHGLIERSLLTAADAVAIIDSARSVQGEVAEAADGDGAASWQSHNLLSSIAASLRFDVPESDA